MVEKPTIMFVPSVNMMVLFLIKLFYFCTVFISAFLMNEDMIRCDKHMHMNNIHDIIIFICMYIYIIQ